MIDDHDLLYHLGDGTELEGQRPLHEIRQLGRQIQRRRQVFSASGTLVAVAAVAIAVPVVIQDHRSRGTTSDRTPAASASAYATLPPWYAQNTSCGDGTRQDFAPAAAAPVRYLPREALAGPLAGMPLFSEITFDCNPPSDQVTWYSSKNGKISRSLTVSGPVLADTGTSNTVGAGAGNRSVTGWVNEMTPTTVGGQPGQYGFDASASTGHVEWLASGQLWAAGADGVTLDEFLTAIRSLQISGGHLDTGQLPAGFDTLGPTLGGRPPAARYAEGRFTFGAAPTDPTGQLIITQAGDEPLDGSDLLVTVNGQPGRIIHQRLPYITWRIAEGTQAVFADLTGQRTDQELLDIAESTVKVPATDPRLTSVQ